MSRASALSGISDLSDISGITELKAQIKEKERRNGLETIAEDQPLDTEFQAPTKKEIAKERQSTFTAEDLESQYRKLREAGVRDPKLEMMKKVSTPSIKTTSVAKDPVAEGKRPKERSSSGVNLINHLNYDYNSP